MNGMQINRIQSAKLLVATSLEDVPSGSVHYISDRLKQQEGESHGAAISQSVDAPAESAGSYW